MSVLVSILLLGGFYIYMRHVKKSEIHYLAGLKAEQERQHHIDERNARRKGMSLDDYYFFQCLSRGISRQSSV